MMHRTKLARVVAVGGLVTALALTACSSPASSEEEDHAHPSPRRGHAADLVRAVGSRMGE